MPVFQYEGTNRGGEKVKGSVDLPSELEVRVFLRERGVRLTKVNKETILNKNIAFGKLVKENEVAVMTRQLSVMLSSGVPILQALDILHAGEKNPYLKQALGKISESVSSGSPLWEALSRQGETFSFLYISLVRAGEFSGSLDIMLKRLAAFLENSVRLRRMVKGAMIYPVSILVVGLLATMGLMIFVVPQFQTIFAETGVELPAITKSIISISEFCVDRFLFILAALVVTFLAFKKYISTEEGKKNWHRFILATPLFGDLAMKSSVAQFSRTMSTMLSSGITLVDAIEICKSSIENVVVQNALTNVKQEVLEGQSMSLPLSKAKIFPSMVVQMINVGESTGGLDEMLERIADFYDEEVETVVGSITKLIEPFVIVLLGTLIAFVLVAMYMPIFELGTALDPG